MAFERPTLSELVQRISSDLETRLDIANAALRKSFTYLFGKVIAGAAHVMHGHLEWISRQIFPSTADTENLIRIASLWGITKTAATYGTGTYQFTGDSGTVIEEDTELVSSDGERYKTTAEVTISGGIATVGIRALTAGENGNTDAGTLLSLASPISGVESEGSVTVAVTGGADEESDDDLLARLEARVQSPPLGGAEIDYENWAKEVAGVTRAWAHGLYLGPGTVGLFFVRDDDTDVSGNPDIIPTSGEIATVSAYIETVRPVTARVTVLAPTPDEIDFSIEITPSTAAVKAAVEAELEDLIAREGEPGGTIYLSHIREAISLADGEIDHTLLSPSADIVSAAGHMPVMGEIVWS